MSSWVDPLTYGLLIFLCLASLLRINKELRGKRGALSVELNLSDLVLLAIVATIFSIIHSLGIAWLALFASILLFVYGLLVFVDAMLFVQYRIEVNRQTLAWCITGRKGLSKGIPHLLSVFKKFPVGVSIPFALALILIVSHSDVSSLYLPILCLVIVSLAFLSIKRKAVFDYLSLVFACLSALALLLYNETSTAGVYVACLGICVGVMLVLLCFIRATGIARSAFFNTPTLLTNILADDSFKVHSQVKLSVKHQPYIKPQVAKLEPSSLHGICNGANIVLITFESLGAYVSPYTENAARSRLSDRLKNTSWISNQHFCLCPNTTVSTNQLYTGAYSNNPYNKSDSLYPGEEPKHVKQLKSAGYKTLFLDSADIGLYDYHKLLKRIGFDQVWGTKDLPVNGLKADYRLWNMVDEIADCADDGPFFLHIINDQTHMPYQVVDKNKFNRHTGSSNKDVYLNAVEEVDYILDEFLNRLAEKIDMSDTLLVFTGDHGESFGEYGYSFHSNSVIKPQMHVPFMLHHPKLGKKEIEHSCHFDLFPTFFDLLGIKCDYPTLGKSLAFDDREFAYFFHSATLKGNTPANFGFMLDGDMYWMDRLFNQASELNKNITQQKLDKGKRGYIQTLLFHMLKERKLLV